MTKLMLPAAALAAGAVALVTACGPSSAAPAAADAAHPAAASHSAKSSHAARHHAAAAPSPSCTRTTAFDYIVRDDDPGASIMADEIGNADYTDCTSSLADFAATAGQASGECTSIAKASDNPGYNINAIPAPPLKDVIMSAGPGC